MNKSELEIGTKIKIFCNTCRIETHHVLKAVHKRSWEEWLNGRDQHASPTFWEQFKYRFWICLGCDTGTLEKAYTHLGLLSPDGQIWESVYFPKRTYHDLLLKRFYRLDKSLVSIYREVIESYNSGLNILCSIGLRALLEGICADKGITNGNLDKKIDGLVEFLPSNIVQFLHSFRFIGNVAAHELQSPSEAELKKAIDVMEDLLNFLYELDYKASMLPRKE